MQAVKPDRYNFSLHGDMCFIRIHQLFAKLLPKNVRTGKDEFTVTSYSLTYTPMTYVHHRHPIISEIDNSTSRVHLCVNCSHTKHIEER